MFLTVEMRSGGRPAESAHRGMRRSSASSPARGGVCVCVCVCVCVSLLSLVLSPLVSLNKIIFMQLKEAF